MTISAKKAAAECVSDEALSHLRSYKYSSVDKSPVSLYVLGPFWNAFVEFLPLWLAPNMVTLIGFGFIIVNVALLVKYIPDLVGPGPWWLYFSFAFGLFMYQTMDNVDGKQARRTGTSSGLGELFDHGIDSLNCTLASLLQTAALGFGSTKAGVVVSLSPCLAMFFSTWETYHTHTLFLGFINGPTEGILLACFVISLSGIFGPGIWSTTIAESFGFDAKSAVGQTSLRNLWLFLQVTLLFLTHIPLCVYNVVIARQRSGLPLLPIFLEWTPMVVFTGAIGLWLSSPFSTLVVENHLVLFCVTMAFVFGRMTTKMILAHLTRQPFPYWTAMLVPLIFGAALGNLPSFGFPPITPFMELAYLWGYLVFAAVLYFRWAILVVGSICDYLGINALTIPVEKRLENEWKAAVAKATPESAVEEGNKKSS